MKAALFFFAACLSQVGTLYSDNKHSSNVSDQNSAVSFLQHIATGAEGSDS